jgi:hypothetical protein
MYLISRAATDKVIWGEPIKWLHLPNAEDAKFYGWMIWSEEKTEIILYLKSTLAAIIGYIIYDVSAINVSTRMKNPSLLLTLVHYGQQKINSLISNTV